MIQMFCNKCGNNLPDNAKFCERCGAPQILPDQRDETHKVESKPSNQLKYVIVGIIVLVIIAIGVIYYVQVGAGYFATQKAQETVYKGATPQSSVTQQRAQETVYKGIEQSTSNIQMIGNVYGLSSNPSAGIDEIKFSIGLAPGSPTIDLRTLKVVFATPTTDPIRLSQGTTASTTVFSTKTGGSAVTSLNPNEQIEISFRVVPVSANTKMSFELRPAVGASLPFSKTTPATIQKTNVLY